MLEFIVLIVGTIILVIGIARYFIFRDNPDYILNHLKRNPETTSLYVAKNGEEFITYQSDLVRPLASTVKIIIAVEYAMQVDEGILNKNSTVPLDDLKRYYIKVTDGGAHESWLTALKNEGKINNNEVTLHEVAKGMVKFSSNANTDFLIHLLGIDAINERAKVLELYQHEKIYPIVSPLLFSEYLKNKGMNKSEIKEELEKMPMDKYRELAKDISLQMKDDTINIEKYTFDMPLDLQRVWSDRLIGDSANDYGKLLGMISNEELPTGANQIVRDLLEWPMEVNEKNHRHFRHLGSKGRSTAFIMNDAMYAEDHYGGKIEMVILVNGLTIWQMIKMSRNLNVFELKIFTDEDYRIYVQKVLSE